jgi:prophage DNA circulation protein
MAWSDELLDASYRGLKFDCLSIDDGFDKDLVEHRFPYKSGAEIEDMGRGPRKVSVTAIFYGDDYAERLKAFIAELEKPGAGELIHPVFGSIKDAQVVRGSIHHEADNVDQAALSFELVESTAGNLFFAEQSASQQTEAVSQHAQAARNASAGTLAGMITQLRALNPLSQLTALRQTLLGPVASLKALAGGVVGAGLDVINYPLSWASDLTALSAGVMNVGGFAVGDLVADYRNAFRRLTGSLGSGTTVTRIDPYTPTEPATIQAAQTHVQVERAASVADSAAAVLAAEAQAPTLTPTEVQGVTNLARIEIEAVIEQVRIVYPMETARPIIENLKDTALALQKAAEAIIVIRPPLITRVVESPVPLRLQAHLWYGDHTRAIELQRMNGLANPNFLAARQALLAYAR